MEFAINKLGFAPEQIVLYGWSIGGFASSLAAEAYPNVRAVVRIYNLLKLCTPNFFRNLALILLQRCDTVAGK